MAVLNIKTKKLIKVIKDVHKNTSVVCVEFVDWILERPNAEEAI